MEEEYQPAPVFPQYAPPNPSGLPVAHPKQSALLMKAIKARARSMAKKPRNSPRKGLTAQDSIRIGHRKKTIWY